ncbi:MAG TPA: hypothetical protein VFE01_10115, partial [Terracidiphilus sp.]|nr:hypothetical protein [Terracidiphilus sp.]
MRTAGRAAFWPMASCLLAVCAAPGAMSQRAPVPAAAIAQQGKAAGGAGVATASYHTVMHLEGPWHFQIGDNPQWSDPALDDSSWAAVTLDKPLSELGFDSYAGYAWYRIRINGRQVQTAGEPLELLLTTHTIGQMAVYANGAEIGHSRGMGDRPQMYMSLPLEVTLPSPAADGTLTIAIRTWAAPGVQISHGLLDRVDMAARHDIVERVAIATSLRWDQQVIASLVLSFLFLFVAAFGAILYIAQR